MDDSWNTRRRDATACREIVMKMKIGTTHFLPMEAPYEVRDHISSYLARLGEGLTAADEVPIKRRLGARAPRKHTP